MAVQMEDIVASIKGDTSDITAKFNDLKSKIDDFGGTVEKTNSKLSEFIKPAAFIAAGAALTKSLTEPMLGFAKSAILAADSLEQAELAYTTMLGSGKAAQKMLNEMRDFAKTTPFEFPELIESGKRLIAFGFNAEQIIPTLRNVGDAVSGLSGNSETMNRVIRAMGQIQAKGRLMTQEMNQLSEAGIRAWDMLADHLGITVAEAMDRVSKKQIDSATALTAIQDGMAREFGGMMEKRSKTLTGIFSNLQDTLSILMQSIGREIMEAFNLKGALKSVQQFAEDAATWFTSLEAGTKRMILIMVAAFAAGGPILVAVGAFMAAMSVITAPMLVTGAIITGIIAGTVAIAAKWEELKSKSTILATVVMALTNAFAFIKDVFSALSDAADKLMIRLGAMAAVVELVGKQLFSTSAFSKEAWEQTIEQVKAIDQWAAAQIKAVDEGRNATEVQLKLTKAVEDGAAASKNAAREARKLAAERKALAEETSKQIFTETFAREDREFKDRYSGSDTMRDNSEARIRGIQGMQADMQKGIEARKRADEDYYIESVQLADAAFQAEMEAQQRGEQAYQEYLGRKIVAQTKAEIEAEGKNQEHLGRFIVAQTQAQQQMAFGWKDVFGSMSQSAQFAFGAIRSQFANTIADMVEGTVSWRDFWKASQRALITSSVNWAIDIVGSFIAKNAMILATEGATALGVTSIWTGTFAAVTGGFASMSSAIAVFFTGTIIPMFASVGTAVATFLSSIASALTLSIFGAPFSAPVWAAVGLVLAAVGVISAFAFGAFAEGGIVKGPMMGLVGEAGPEAIIPLDQLGSIMGGGETTVIVELEGRVLAKAVFDGMPSVMRLRGMSA